MQVQHVEEPLEGDSLVFAGDYVGSTEVDSPPVTNGLCDHIRGADAAVVNFEAPIETGTPQPKHGPIIGQDPADVREVADLGFECVTLANNHIMDHGEPGLTATIEACHQTGLETVGAGTDLAAAIDPLTLTVGGTTIAVFNACEKEFGLATDIDSGAAWIGHLDFEQAIKTATENYDLVVLVAHGGIEYVPLPPPSWQRRLRQFVDLGVDAVIAHHPHVALPWEHYDGVPIVYSLGNFVFDNDSRPETEWTYLLELEIEDRAISTVGVRLAEAVDGRVRPMAKQRQQDRWQFLTELSELIQRAPSEPGYWQETAIRIFDNRYHGRLDDYGNGRFLSSVRNPVYEADRLTRGIFSTRKRARTQQLAVLNYARSDCHRDVIEAALGVKTGTVTDHRTPTIRNTIDEYFNHVNTRANWGLRERLLWYGGKAFERLRSG